MKRIEQCIGLQLISRFLIATTIIAGSFMLSPSGVAQDAPKTHWDPYRTWNRAPSEDQHLVDPVLDGAIDLHVHHGPDAYPRQWDVFEVARIAHERGMRGIVIKNHWTETAGLAALVYQDLDGALEVFGGLAFNTPIGGVNEQALRYFADVSGGRGRVVWMPTHDSAHEVAVEGTDRASVAVSRNGDLLPEVFAVLDLIAEHDLTLATGHVTPTEALAIMREAKSRGIEHIIVTHPSLGEQYTYMSDDELRAAVALGGLVEITAGTLYRDGPGRTRAIEIIQMIGPENIFVGSDSGLIGTPNLADALVMAARQLRVAGFDEDDLDLMFKSNPARLLGLAPQ